MPLGRSPAVAGGQYDARVSSTAKIIDGKALAEQYRRDIKARVAALKGRGVAVRLDALLADAGDNAARVYAENQGKTCAELGIEYKLHHFRPDAHYDEIAGRVLLLNTKDEVPAIMVHLPLPAGVEPYRIQRLIAPEKDIEGVNPANIGNVVYGQSSLVPCTALAVLKMIQSTGIELRGKRAVVVGAGDVVGKPIAVLLMRQEATVISCNKWSWGLEEMAKSADVLVAAAGVPGLITAKMVKAGAVVIDVGVNRVAGVDGKMKTVGDVEFEGAKEVAGHISPVPGGVGPMTVAMLLLNVVEAAERHAGFAR
jgi:methylenetetrahydrofolate dehydrogenase (NADP+) / methenyltetrahydrofolate cyclohydrolase